MKRVFGIILDSVGCGNAPDAADYGDTGADTLGHLFARIPGFALPALGALGLDVLLGRDGAHPLPGASWCRLTETSAGKDTTTGHWELLGLPVEEAFATYEAFPEDFVAELAGIADVGFLGNKPASGTVILDELGAAHVATGKPILYTSADSVLQLAAHEESFGLQRLWDLCEAARGLLDRRGMRVGRVIARPFVGDAVSGFRRTGNRRDYSLIPGETALNRLRDRGVCNIGVGKISDIFAGSGIEVSHPSKSNAEGMRVLDRLVAEVPGRPTFILANLVDFDALFGHRRDPQGYADCLQEFDAWLAGFLPRLRPGDLLLITADHGNDPYHSGTDHTREQVPMLALGGIKLEDGTFSRFAQSVEGWFARG
ncbi:MAG: phosphopentomutase [Luteolibacter sp.]